MARKPMNTTIEETLQGLFNEWLKDNSMKKNDVLEMLIRAVLNGEIEFKQSLKFSPKED